MEHIRNLQWPLVLGLGALALVRPLMNIVGLTDRIGRPAAPLLVTLAITLVWVGAVGLTRVSAPVLTLTFAGLAYGVLSIAVSAILSPILTGRLAGPLATPYGLGVVPVLVLNAAWGAVAGVLAMLLHRRRGAGDRA